MKYIHLITLFLIPLFTLGQELTIKPDTVYTYMGKVFIGDIVVLNERIVTIRVDGDEQTGAISQIRRIVNGQGEVLYFGNKYPHNILSAKSELDKKKNIVIGEGLSDSPPKSIDKPGEENIKGPSETKAISKGNATMGGAAIQFRIDNLLQLSSFRGTTLSLQSKRTNNSAYRIGVTIEGLAEELEYQSSTMFYSANDSLLYSTYSDDGSPGKKHAYFGVSVEGLSYHYAHTDINIYSGAGIYVGIGQTRELSEDINNSYIKSAEQEVTTLTVGINGLLGAEWYVMPRISIHGEYNVGLSLNKVESKTQNYSEAVGTGSYTEQVLEGNGVTYGVISEVIFGVSIHIE